MRWQQAPRRAARLFPLGSRRPGSHGACGWQLGGRNEPDGNGCARRRLFWHSTRAAALFILCDCGLSTHHTARTAHNPPAPTVRSHTVIITLLLLYLILE